MSNKKIKLVCTDLDGTLLDDKKEISERNRDSLKKAIEKGAHVVITTGRFYGMAKEYAKDLGLDSILISTNGAYVKSLTDDIELSKSILGYNNCLDIYRILLKYNLKPLFSDHETIYYDDVYCMMKFNEDVNGKRADMGRTMLKEIKDWSELFEDRKDDLLKCLIINQDPVIMAKAREELETYPELEIVSALKDSFEIMYRGVSKGEAVKIVAKHYGITKDEVMCIGDGENDLTMIKYAGIGVAMGNAEDCLKEHANYITADNNLDGLAKAIESHVL